jgi:hypothetical protein
MTPSGIDPAHFHIEAQFLNQPRHRVPAIVLFIKSGTNYHHGAF